MSYSVYILQSVVNKKLYYGSSKDPKSRLEYHNEGKQRWTKGYRPWKLIYSQEVSDKKQALILERKLKGFKNPEYVLELIENGRLTEMTADSAPQ